MPWNLLNDGPTSDVSFRAESPTLDGLFACAVDALVSMMVPDLSSIVLRTGLSLSLCAETLEMLLFDLLQQVIFEKDAHSLLLRAVSLHVREASGKFSVDCLLRGEPIDADRHAIAVDVKAVTLWRYRVERTDRGWEAEATLDV